MGDDLKQTKATEEGEDAKGHNSGRPWLVLGGLMMAYVLSVGPVARYCQSRNILPPRPVCSFYTPLAWMASRCGPVRRFFDWYVGDLWCANIHATPSTPPEQGR